MTLRRPAWLIGLFVVTLALGTDEFVIAGLLPEISDNLDLFTGLAGQLITAFAVAFAVGAPVMGVLLEPYPRRPVLLTALTIFASANLAAAVAPGFGALIALRVVAGLAAAAVSSTAFATAAQGAPQGRQGGYLSTVTAGLTVALFTGVPAGAWVGGMFGWRSTFILIGGVAVVAMVVTAIGLPDLDGSPAAGLDDRLRPLQNTRLLRLVVAVCLSGAGGLMFYSYLAPVVEHSHGDTGVVPAVLLMVGVIGVPAVFVGGWLADRYGGRRSRLTVIGGHSSALALLTVLLLMDAAFPLVLVGVALWSICAWAFNPPLHASALEVMPAAPMAAVSLNISGLYLGTALGGVLGGVLVDGPGVLWIPPAAAILMALAWTSASFRSPQQHATTPAGAREPRRRTAR